MPNTKEVEQMSNQKCTLTDSELITKCEEWISKLCKTGGRAWVLSVPVELNNDPDVLLSEIMNRFKALSPLEQSENDQLKRKLEFYRNETSKIRDYVFDNSNKCGYPTQSIFEAITDKIDSLTAENDRLKSVEQSENKEEWVSCSDRLPEDMQSVLFCTEDVHDPAMIPIQGYYNATAKVWIGYLWSQKRTDVTHWMYTPKPPKNLA